MFAFRSRQRALPNRRRGETRALECGSKVYIHWEVTAPAKAIPEALRTSRLRIFMVICSRALRFDFFAQNAPSLTEWIGPVKLKSAHNNGDGHRICRLRLPRGRRKVPIKK